MDVKQKKTTINPINKKDEKCFKFTATVALNHEEIKKYPQRITKIKPFIDKYNWKGINYPSEKNDWKKFEKKNLTIAFKLLLIALFINSIKLHKFLVKENLIICEILLLKGRLVLRPAQWVPGSERAKFTLQW